MFLVRLTLLSSALVFCCTNVVAESAYKSDHQATMTTIREVKRQYQDEWLRRPEVVSVGIGLNADQKPIVIIGVKRINSALKQEFPTEVKGYPIELQVVGSPKAQ